jgi:hypothetical protein
MIMALGLQKAIFSVEIKGKYFYGFINNIIKRIHGEKRDTYT